LCRSVFNDDDDDNDNDDVDDSGMRVQYLNTVAFKNQLYNKANVHSGLQCPCNYELSREISVCIAMGYGLDSQELGVRFQVRARDFLFSTAFRPALWPVQFPTQ
jgi:hypothetical protein